MPGRHRTLSTRSWTTPVAATPPADWWACASPPPRCRPSGGSTVRSGRNATTVLSCCNYAPLCMPLPPREHTHRKSHKRTSHRRPSSARVSVCVLVQASHLYDAHPSLPACVCTPCAEAARHSHSLHLHREHPLGRGDSRLGTQPVAGRSFSFPRVFRRSIAWAPPPGPRRRRPCGVDSAASEEELLVEVVVEECEGWLYCFQTYHSSEAFDVTRQQNVSRGG